MTNKKTWHAHYPESIAAEVTIPSKSMPEMLQEVTAMYPQNMALSFYGRKINYAELQKAVYGFAASLQKNNVQKGDRVAIMLPNCPQYVIAYYGILAAGAIVTQVNPMLVEREIEHIMNDSGS